MLKEIGYSRPSNTVSEDGYPAADRELPAERRKEKKNTETGCKDPGEQRLHNEDVGDAVGIVGWCRLRKCKWCCKRGYFLLRKLKRKAVKEAAM